MALYLGHKVLLYHRKIQEETLRTYIFTYGETYDTLSLVSLSEMFELPLKTVHSIVSKMIFKEEFLVRSPKVVLIYALLLFPLNM